MYPANTSSMRNLSIFATLLFYALAANSHAQNRIVWTAANSETIPLEPASLHATFPHAEIIVFGHTHQPLLELVDRTVTVMNPGSAGPRRFDLPISLGIMELEPGIPPRARLVTLQP